MKGGYEKLRFSTITSLYLPNNAIYSNSYYGRWIENRTQPFEWYHFQRSWVTRNLNFKDDDIIQRQITRKSCNRAIFKKSKVVDLYSASSWSTSNALPFPVSRRWSPQANPTARHQRTLRDHVIRVGAPRDMPVYFPAFAGTKLYCLVTEAVGCEQLA